MADLYETDILLWSEQQAELLRRIAAGDAAAHAELDLPNLIEEISDVGIGILHNVEDFLVDAMRALLKEQAWPKNPQVYQWRVDAVRFRSEARRRVSPAMKERIDIAQLYREARSAIPEAIEGEFPQAMPATCPEWWTLNLLLADDLVL